ncbi:hypothetical protein QUB60_29355 [Microcoleus sp. A2-C5]|uniref:hypothetical protein n=1 Tax=unclassified Microcoleus TaxID=2642155 RepID=UPI002FD1FB3C
MATHLIPFLIGDWRWGMISSAIDRNISALGASLPDIRVAPNMVCSSSPPTASNDQ